MIVRMAMILFLAIAPGFAGADVSNGDDKSGRWSTRFDRIPAQISKDWRCARIFIDVPRNLTVSEAETYAPKADIVWRGDPPGDRYRQVEAILDKAVRKGVRHLKGSRRVDFYVKLRGFHSLTNKTRYTLNKSGVHNISFDVTVRDRRTGQQIGKVYTIHADLPSLGKKRALAADAAGHSQKKRVTNFLTNVIISWTGYGQDMRRSFNRIGQ